MTKNRLFTLAFTKILKHYLTIDDKKRIPDIVKDLIIALNLVEMRLMS